MAGQKRSNHDHRGPESDALGDIAVTADAAVSYDWFSGHPGTPLECAELPPAGAEAGLHDRDADLAGSDPHLDRVCSPALKVDDRLRGGHVASD
jgi:hypothetical protein